MNHIFYYEMKNIFLVILGAKSSNSGNEKELALRFAKNSVSHLPVLTAFKSGMTLIDVERKFEQRTIAET